MRRLAFLLVSVCLTGGVSGCLSYSVGTAPGTVAPGEVEPIVAVQAVSDDRQLDEDPETRPGRLGGSVIVMNEARLGLDERSDVGVRLIGLGGAVVNYKRRVVGEQATQRGVSVMVGSGLVGGSHLHLEGTLIASPGALSSDGLKRMLPYGGLRVQGLVPIGTDAASLSPALGAFGGMRFGWEELAITPELGLFYQPSPYTDDPDVIVVPSVTVRGNPLRRALGL